MFIWDTLPSPMARVQSFAMPLLCTAHRQFVKNVILAAPMTSAESRAHLQTVSADLGEARGTAAARYPGGGLPRSASDARQTASPSQLQQQMPHSVTGHLSFLTLAPPEN